MYRADLQRLLTNEARALRVWLGSPAEDPRLSYLPGILDHDESSPTPASDCSLTFNLVSSCAWMNMAVLWISALMYTSRLEERASASCGN